MEKSSKEMKATKEEVKSQAIKIISKNKAAESLFNSLWFKLSEPRFITLMFSIFYGLSIIYGFHSLLNMDPLTVELPRYYVGPIVSMTFIVGGIIGIINAPRGLWQFERAGMIFISTGFFVNLCWLLVDPTPGIHWGRIYKVLIALILIAIRYSMTAWARQDPEK